MNFKKVKILVYKHPLLGKVLYPAAATRRFFLRKSISRAKDAYEHLRHILVGDVVLRVDEFQGVFTVDCRSDLFKHLFLYKEYEPSLVELTLKHIDRDRDVIDVGANVGFYTVLFARNLNRGKVLAIEPALNALDRLYKNIRLNNVNDKTIVFEGAASDLNRRGEIKTLDGKEEYTTLGSWGHPSVRGEDFVIHETEVSTIDSLVARYSLKPGFIKIDAEGMEYSVLKGAKETLEKDRPVVLSELSGDLLKQNGSSSVEVIRFLGSLNYTVVDADVPGARPEIMEFTNILCIPRELTDK